MTGTLEGALSGHASARRAQRDRDAPRARALVAVQVEGVPRGRRRDRGAERRRAAGCRIPASPQGHRRFHLRRDPGGARGRACPATSRICASAPGCEKASELRALLRGDLHSHSDWSDGLTSIDLMVDAARALGHEYLALTDHSPRLRVANGLSPERLREQLGVVAGMSGDGFTLLSGIEVDILDDGALDQEPGPARRARHRRRLGAFQAAHGARADDAAPRRGGVEPARRRARPRHRPARRGLARHPAAVDVRRRAWCSRRAPRTASRSRSTRGPSGRIRPTSCSRSRSSSDACSRSTRTRMRPGSCR